MRRTARTALLALPVAALTLAGCGDEGGPATGAAAAVAVTSTDEACTLDPAEVQAGTVTFTVENAGSQVTELYVYGTDGTTILGEVENVGPGLRRELTVSLEPGLYEAGCKPGMTGDGLRAELAVTASSTTAGSAVADPQLAAAAAAYVDWVAAETDALLAGTREFATAVEAGDAARAQALYAPVRTHWERVEPVAESFGDLDPRLDAREGDLPEGEPLTGWHRLERDLWVDGLQADSAAIAQQMVADTTELASRVAGLELTVDRVTNGAKELLDEVATGKITGEEERWSHTDLWDFQANLEGSAKAYEVVREVVVAKDPDLAATLDREFAAMATALDGHRRADGFVAYTELDDADLRALSTRLEALSEPVARLTAVLLS